MDFLAEWDAPGENIASRAVKLEQLLDKYRTISNKIDYTLFFNDFGTSGAGTLLIARVVKATLILLGRNSSSSGAKPVSIPKTNLSVFFKVLMLFFEVHGKDFSSDCVKAGTVTLCERTLQTLPVTRQEELVLVLKLLFRISSRRPDAVLPPLVDRLVQLVKESSFEPYSALVGNVLESLRNMLDMRVVGELFLNPHLHVKALGVRLTLYLLRQSFARKVILNSDWIKAPSFLPQLARLLLGATGKEQYDTAVLASFLVEYSEDGLGPMVIDQILCTFLLSGDILSSSEDGVSPRSVVRFDMNTDIAVGLGPPQSPYLMAQFMVDRIIEALANNEVLVGYVGASGLVDILVNHALQEAFMEYDDDTRQDRMHERGSHTTVALTYLPEESERDRLNELVEFNDRVVSAVALLEGFATNSSVLRKKIMHVLLQNHVDAVDDGQTTICAAFIWVLGHDQAFKSNGEANRVLRQTSEAVHRGQRIKTLICLLEEATAWDTAPTLISVRRAAASDPRAADPGELVLSTAERKGRRMVDTLSAKGSKSMTKTAKQPYKYPALRVTTGFGDEENEDEFSFNPWDTNLTQETSQMLLQNMAMTSPTKPKESMRSKKVVRSVGSPLRSPRKLKVREPHQDNKALSVASKTTLGGSPRSPGSVMSSFLGIHRSSPCSPVDPIAGQPVEPAYAYLDLQAESENILQEIEQREAETLGALLSHNKVMRLARGFAKAAVYSAVTHLSLVMEPSPGDDIAKFDDLSLTPLNPDVKRSMNMFL